MQWLDECLQRHQEKQQTEQQQQQQQKADNDSLMNDSVAVSSSSNSSSASSIAQQVFAPVVGAGIAAERTRSAQAAADRNVAGMVVYAGM